MKLFKKINGIILSAVMLISVFAVAPAVQVSAAAKKGNYIDYKYNKKTQTLTVFGKGPIYDYNDWYDNGADWNKYKPKKVVIKDGITRIGDESFKSMKSIEKLTIADSVKSIGAWAFFKNKRLKTVKFGKNVKKIEYLAFGSCPNLNKINLPKSVKVISHDAFAGTAFYDNKKNWTDNGMLYLGKHLLEANEEEICGTKPSGDVKIRKGTLTISEMAFIYNREITSVSIPKSVVYIGEEAFSNTEKLKKFKVSADNKYFTAVDGNLYSKDKTKLIQYAIGKEDKSFVIPDTVTKAGEEAFAGCAALESVTVPGSLKTISEAMFQDCANLSDVKLKKGVKKISSYAFRCCSSLKSLVLPEGFKSTGIYVFEYCNNLESITVPESAKDVDILGFDEGYEGETPLKLTILGKTGTKAERMASGYGCIFKDIETGFTIDFGVERPENPMTVTAKNQKVKASTLKKKTVRLNVLTITDADGDLSFDGAYLFSGDDDDDQMFENISVDEKTGEIVLKKGKYQKRTLKVDVRVHLFSRNEYDDGSAWLTVKIKVV